MIFLVIKWLLIVCPVVAALDHWVGGARLFRGRKNAEAAEAGQQTWFWDRRWVPYSLFTLFVVGCCYCADKLYLAPGLCGTYFWLRGFSPRPIFPAGNGRTTLEIWAGVKAGGWIGLRGLAPGLLGVILNPWLALTPLLGLLIGVYHWLWHGNPLFRSYGELMQGGLAVGPFIVAFIVAG